MTDHLALIPTEPLSSEVKRIAVDIADRALGHIRTAEEDIDLAIHETRKRCKEMRAMLRLVRDETGRRSYHHENSLFRDNAKKLSGARDIAVLLETVSSLLEHPRTATITNGLRGLQEKFRERYDTELEKIIADNVFSQIEEALVAAQQRLRSAPLRRRDFHTFRKGIERVYGRGLRAMVQARTQPTDENLHEWRKRAKYLWYHVRVLTPTWPAVLSGLSESLHRLSDLLGDDHDLAVFSEMLRTQSRQIPTYILPDLMSLTGRLRRELRREIWPLGVRVYAETPNQFGERLETYWRAGTRMEA